MDAYQLLDGEVIRYDQALKTKLTAQNIAKQPGIAVIGNTIEFVVRRHDRASFALVDPGVERRQKILSHRALRIIRRRDVRSCFRLTVHCEMFQRGKDMVAVYVRTIAL